MTNGCGSRPVLYFFYLYMNTTREHFMLLFVYFCWILRARRRERKSLKDLAPRTRFRCTKRMGVFFPPALLAFQTLDGIDGSSFHLSSEHATRIFRLLDQHLLIIMLLLVERGHDFLLGAKRGFFHHVLDFLRHLMCYILSGDLIGGRLDSRLQKPLGSSAQTCGGKQGPEQ
jgi:hypothetical protein